MASLSSSTSSASSFVEVGDVPIVADAHSAQAVHAKNTPTQDAEQSVDPFGPGWSASDDEQTNAPAEAGEAVTARVCAEFEAALASDGRPSPTPAAAMAEGNQFDDDVMPPLAEEQDCPKSLPDDAMAQPALPSTTTTTTTTTTMPRTTGASGTAPIPPGQVSAAAGATPFIIPLGTMTVPGPLLVLLGQVLFMLYTALFTLCVVRMCLVVEQGLLRTAMDATLPRCFCLSSESSAILVRALDFLSTYLLRIVLCLGWLAMNVSLVMVLRRSHDQVLRWIWFPLKVSYPLFVGTTSVTSVVTEIRGVYGLSQMWQAPLCTALCVLPWLGLVWSTRWWASVLL